MVKILLKYLLSLVLVIGCAVFCSQTYAQDNDDENQKMYRITLKNGEVIYAFILKRTANSVFSKSEMYGELEIPQKKIKEIRRYNQRLQQVFPEETVFTNSINFIGPTAYNLKKGESYLSNRYLFYNHVSYGVTDRFQIGGGFEFLSMLFGNGPTYFLNTKTNKEIGNKWKVSGNLFYANGNLLDNKNLFGTVVTSTVGDYKNNLSLGVGTMYYHNGFLEKPAFTLGIVKRITDKISFISDNVLVEVAGNYTYFSYGLRVFGEQMALDFFFVNNQKISNRLVVGFPVVGAVFEF